AEAGDVPAGACQVGDEPRTYRIAYGHHDDWNYSGCSASRNDRWRGPGDDDIDVGFGKFTRNSGILLKTPSGPANVNGEVVSFDTPALRHALPKCRHHGGRGRGSRKTPPAGLPNSGSRMILCVRPHRPRRCRTAEQRDEIAPPQLIELHSVPSHGRIADIELAEVSQELFGATQQPWAGTPAEAPSPSSPRVHSISLPPMSFSPFLDDCHGVLRI